MPLFSKIETVIKRKVKFKFDKRVFIFLFFLVCSCAIWLMNRLSQEYSSVFSYSLASKSDNIGGLIVSQSENQLYVRGKATGFYILRSKINQNDTLYLSLKDKKPIKVDGEKNIHAFLVNTIRDKIADALQNKVSVENVWPDTIFFASSKFSSKKVPVQPHYQLSFASQYRQIKEIRLIPDSIMLQGQQSVLDTIRAVGTYVIKHENLQGNENGSVELIPINGVSFSNVKVRYTINVKRVTEGLYKLPIKLLNLPDKYSVFLFPTEAEISFIAPLDTFEYIKPQDFSLIVDINQASNAISRKLKVELEKKPHNIFNVAITPPYVEFVMHENND